MPTLETPRLILRDITEMDFAAIHSYGGNIDNVNYMAWGPNSEEGTRAFITHAIEMAQAEAMNPIPLGVYRHYKGNLYEVVGFARHSETLEDMVIYKALYGDGGTWVRPLSMWDNLIEVHGKTVKRFEYIRDE